MRFKNSKQRAAVMASLSERNRRYVRAHPSAVSKSFNQLNKQEHFMKLNTDSDGDGVKNKNDCQPLNKNKQGWMHDFKMKRLKAKEESVEKKREAQQKKLSDTKDELKLRRSIAAKEGSVKAKELAGKQAVIDQIKAEQNKLDETKREEAKAQDELDNYTWTGKTKKFLKSKGENLKNNAAYYGKKAVDYEKAHGKEQVGKLRKAGKWVRKQKWV